MNIFEDIENGNLLEIECFAIDLRDAVNNSEHKDKIINLLTDIGIGLQESFCKRKRPC